MNAGAGVVAASTSPNAIRVIKHSPAFLRVPHAERWFVAAHERGMINESTDRVRIVIDTGTSYSAEVLIECSANVLLHVPYTPFTATRMLLLTMRT